MAGPSLIQAREAKKVCQRCPVELECHEFALVTDERFGIWGGRFREVER